MAKKSQHKQNRPHGHYCKICGEYKANEKFSGKGHAAHICKECAKLSPAERSEAETITRLWNLPGKFLNEGERKWLNNRVHDQRPEVASTAREIRNMIFPFAERNERKQQLHIDTLTFELHTEVYDEYGDEYLVNQKFAVDRRTNILALTDFDRDGETQSVTLDGGKKRKLLNWIVHSLEIFAWPEDYQLREEPEYDPFDPDIDLFPEYRAVDSEDEGLDEAKEAPAEPEGDPFWRVHIEYRNGEEQDIACYLDYLPDRAGELYAALMDYFASDEPEDYYDQEWEDDNPLK